MTEKTQLWQFRLSNKTHVQTGSGTFTFAFITLILERIISLRKLNFKPRNLIKGLKNWMLGSFFLEFIFYVTGRMILRMCN